jgi:hypothetical protein
VFASNQVQEPTTADPRRLSHRDLAVLLYKERRARDVYLKAGTSLWSDPAWDMLLDLFIANEEGRLVNVTSACIGGCIPTSTGLRRVGQLLEAGLIQRTTDASDGRKGMLGLTVETTAHMRRYLDEVVRSRR